MSINRVSRIFCAVFVSLSPVLVSANFIGNDTQNFNPTPSALDFVTVQSSETLAKGFFNSGFFVNYSKNSLPTTVDNLGQSFDSNDSLLFGDFNLGYGLTQRFDVGVTFSYLLDQQTNREESGAQFGATGLNEIRLASKFKLIDRAPIGVALIPSLNLNMANNSPFAGQGSGPTFNFEVAADSRVGRFLIATNLGYRLRGQGDKIEGAVFDPLPNQFIGSIAASTYIPSVDLKLISEIYAAKPAKSVAYVDAEDISSEFLLGLKYDAWTNGSVHFGGGSRLGDGLFTPDWRLYLGLNFAFDVLKQPAKSPENPAEERATNVVQLNMYKGYQPRDIEILRDYSFDEIAKRHEFNLTTSVPNSDDQSFKPPFEIVRLSDFDFDFGSAEIRPQYFPLLNRLADYLAAKPAVMKIRVEGHTDSIGSLVRNRIVSQKRADSLAAYLKKTGKLNDVVVEPVGFGSDRPIADNANFQGRQQNRRVEIRILRRIIGPSTKVE